MDDQSSIGPDNGTNILSLTADVVAAYVGHNSVRVEDISSVIAAVHDALSQSPGRKAESVSDPRTPAVAIKKSVTPDYMISLETGQKFKSLKRHLRTAYGMTPDEYRRKWGLPSDYPMVAPNYARTRSEMAKARGFGRKAGTPSAAQKQEPAANPAPAKRGRRAKAA